MRHLLNDLMDMYFSGDHDVAGDPQIRAPRWMEEYLTEEDRSHGHNSFVYGDQVFTFYRQEGDKVVLSFSNESGGVTFLTAKRTTLMVMEESCQR